MTNSGNAKDFKLENGQSKPNASQMPTRVDKNMNKVPPPPPGKVSKRA